MNFNGYKHTISSAEAMRTALRYAGENRHEVIESGILCREGLYEVKLRTSFMSYELYIDAASGEVLGFDSAPTEPAQWYETLRCTA